MLSILNFISLAFYMGTFFQLIIFKKMQKEFSSKILASEVYAFKADKTRLILFIITLEKKYK